MRWTDPTWREVEGNRPKRRKAWVNEYGHELGSIAWHTVRGRR